MKEIIPHRGGSESDELKIKGAALALRQAGRGAHLITSAIGALAFVLHA